MDYSTINLEKLKSFPTFRLPGATTDDAVSVSSGRTHWSLQTHPGNGCFLDAPGYPTYFTRNVYRNGNNPSSGPQLVITYEGKHYVVATWDDDDWAVVQKRLHSLWKPLPFAHERVTLWMSEMYRYHAHCYHDEKRLVAEDHSNSVIFPVPEYKLKRFVDDERFSDEWREKAKAEVEAYNMDIQVRTAAIAKPENHQAHFNIKRFYPEALPFESLINHPPKTNLPMWWETEATRPTPETCKPRNGIGSKTHDADEWCQWCGQTTLRSSLGVK